MIRILIFRDGKGPCNCSIVNSSYSLIDTFIFSARPGRSVGDEEERCWDLIHENYGGSCQHGNSWTNLYVVQWSSEGEVSALYNLPTVKLFLDDEEPSKNKRIFMPDGTDGLNCVSCGNYFPYVLENCSNGYKCGFCKL